MLKVKINFPQSLLKSNIARNFASYTPQEKIHFSNGNSKTHTPSIDLPAGVFCNKSASCWLSGRCYACWLRDGAQRNYIDNMHIALNDINTYFNNIRDFLTNKVKGNFFRYHVSGEIINTSYLENMVEIAREFKNITFWTYTKKYSLVNNFLDNHRLPKNLVIMFSADENLRMNNPHKLPIFSQYYLGNEQKAIEYAKTKGFKHISFCCGDCSICQNTNSGCPFAKKNSIIYCHIHGQRFNSYNRWVKIKGLAKVSKNSKIFKEYTANNKFYFGVLKF